MELLRHDVLTPMLVVNGDINHVTKYIFDTSTSVPVNTKRLFWVSNEEKCNLDPGGMYFLKVPKMNFEIDNFKFEIQISKAAEILELMDCAKERVPGFKRFPTFSYFVVMTVGLFEKLKVKLKEIELDSESLHAELYEMETRDNLKKSI